MRAPNENKLDQLFKAGLAASDNPIAFWEHDWVEMRKLLKKNSSQISAIYPFVYYASGIAAILLLTIGLFLLDQQHTGNLPNDKFTKRVIKSQQDHLKNNLDQNSRASLPVGKKKSDSKLLNNPKNEYVQSILILGNSSSYYNQDILKKLQQIGVNADLFSKSNQGKELPNMLSKLNVIPEPIASEDPSLPVEREKAQPKKPFIKISPVFTLSLLAAPDINGVNSLNNGQIGGNLGFQLGIKLSQKWSISTGAVYAVKPYGININTNTTNYTANGTYAQPLNYIDANCSVLDIPLNLNYRLYNKGKNTLVVGTGLSSYFMLRETYRYDYGPEYSTVQIKNRNQHIMGVLNLNTTYMRRVNSKFSIIAQPYIKLPLTGIGNGRVDLQSTGIGLGVNWNLNLKQKSK
ncbi:hypothetical protein [Arcticibacter eurypsychrophilus]|uniref:hypothetical protein n=1 Tax=Arcticibacter eurypsychrophilus TaxID=1434752 RepID=UPI00084D1E1C|nr:hypothetical protein [Arcticibacter eurypsychrophilus]